jgi:hypothetical protein
LGNGKIIVQYDNRSYTPRQISDHEAAHGRENTAAFRKVMNVVKNSLSVTEQNRIFDELYADYKGLEKGDAEYILKEFICDVLSGMSEYSAQFADMSNAFWNGGDISAEAYSPAEYAGSIDAGGFADSVGFGDIIYSVDSSGKETVLPGNVTKADAIKALMSIAGKPLVNNETGIMAYVNSTQRKKIMSTQALEKSQNNGFTFNEHNAAVQNIVELFKRANLSERVEDKYGNANLNIARFTVPVAFDLGNNKTDRGQVKFTVKETVENGRRIYSLEIEQIETSQAIAVTATTSANAAPETLSNDIIHPDNENVNSILPENEKNIDDVRYSIETEDSDRQLTLEDWLSGLIDDYGYIEPGESPTREVKIPKQTGKDKYISKFARTALEAAATPDDGLSYFEEALRDGKMAHMRLTDAAASKFAKGKIEESGFDGALEYWDAAIKSDKNIDKNDLALGILLYNQAINAKDARTAMKVAVEISDAGTRAGQTVQAIRLLKKMTPDAQLYSLEKSVQSINRDIKEALKGKHPDVEIDEGLAQDLLDAKNEEERKKAREAILQNIADQIPSTVMDKWNAWRYLSMLGNLKTHIRNIVGNALFVPVIRLKNVVAAGLENAFIADTQNRTKALTAPKALKDFAKNDFKAVKDDIRGASGKYQTLNGIEERRKIFKTKWLEAARKFNFDMLEKEDLYFLRIAYTDSFAKIAAARGVTSEFLSDGSAKANETLELLREYAILEAQKATYRDLNDAARAISMAQRRWVKSDKLVVKAMGLSVESILPFKNTPANILKRGVEYSPLEFIKVLARDIGAVKKGEKTGSELIDDLAKGLVGSALLTLGMLLARWGLIRGAGDEDSKKDRFDKTNGLQPYALYVGGRSYTVDWMAPLSLPLFIGVELYGALNAGENFTFRKMTEAAAKITEPMLELSMLQGISGVLESVKYDEGNPTVAIASEAIVSYASQAAPTLLAQIARTTDNTRRTIYTDKNARLPAFVNETIQRIQTKLPVLNRLLQPSLDAWGREINYEDGYLGAAIENFISPGYFDTVEVNGVTKELNRLYSSQGENAVYPTKQGKSVTIDKRKIDFTGEQYTWFAKKRGELSLAKVKKVLQSGAYRASNDANKIKQIKAAYDDAYDETKKAFTKKYKK